MALEKFTVIILKCLFCYSFQNLMIDEADEAMPASKKRSLPDNGAPASPRPNKRKAGKWNYCHPEEFVEKSQLQICNHRNYNNDFKGAQ